MTLEDVIKMLEARLDCMRRSSSGIDEDCNSGKCDDCDLNYAQGTIGEQQEALKEVISALRAQDLQPTCNRLATDTISRQAAIDVLDKHLRMTDVPVSYPGIVSALTEWLNELPSAQSDSNKYEYHYDHTDCIWYRPEARNRCPVTCAQYRDGWNDAMNYIFRDGKGYRPYRRDEKYGE